MTFKMQGFYVNSNSSDPSGWGKPKKTGREKKHWRSRLEELKSNEAFIKHEIALMAQASDVVGDDEQDCEPGTQSSLCTQEIPFQSLTVRGPFLPEALVPQDEEPRPGFAILEGMQGDEERLKRILGDLTKAVQMSALENITSLAEDEQPKGLRFTDFLNAPAYPRGERFRSPSPDYEPNPPNRPMCMMPLRKVIDFCKLKTPAAAMRQEMELEEPPSNVLPRTVRMVEDMDVVYEDDKETIVPWYKIGDKNMAQRQPPMCFDILGLGHWSWPRPIQCRVEDMTAAYATAGDAFVYIAEIVSKNTKSGDFRKPENFHKESFTKVLSKRQLDLVERWCHFPGSDFTEADDNDILEIWEYYQKSRLNQKFDPNEGRWSHMCAFFMKDIHDRHAKLTRRGMKHKEWTMAEKRKMYKTYVDNIDEPDRYDKIFRVLGGKRTRRSIVRNLELMFLENRWNSAVPITEADHRMKLFLEESDKKMVFSTKNKKEDDLHRLLQCVHDHLLSKDIAKPKKGFQLSDDDQKKIYEIYNQPYHLLYSDFEKLLNLTMKQFKFKLEKWTKYETSVLMMLHNRYGGNFSNIAESMRRRTQRSCYEKYQELIANAGYLDEMDL